VVKGKEILCEAYDLPEGTHKLSFQLNDTGGNRVDYSYVDTVTITPGPVCFTDKNSAHAAAGRTAVKYNMLYYALGSNDYLGLSSTTTSLEEVSVNHWKKVPTCP
jgi:hypothetical protein